MKRIGILGGMSYESALHYYEQINRKVNERAGGFISADLVLRSVNFGEYHKLMDSGDWSEIAHRLSFEALDLVLKNECKYIAIATNIMHKVADKISGQHEIINNVVWPPTPTWVDIPLVHIGDCIAKECWRISAKRVLLLDTKFTMTEDFMNAHLAEYDIEVMDMSDYLEGVNEINRIIFEELRYGVVTPESKKFMLNFVRQFLTGPSLKPDAIVLGCTELNMILNPDDVDIPIIDSTQVHIDRLVELCLS